MAGTGIRSQSRAPHRAPVSRYIAATQLGWLDPWQPAARMSAVPRGQRTTHSRSTAASESLSAGSAAALAAIGLLTLAAGVLVYLADRDVARTTLIPAVALIAGSHLFGAIGQWLPSFVHPFAFSLLTAAVPARTVWPGYGACAAWWAVNVVFEMAQHPGMKLGIAEGVEAVLGRTGSSRLLSSYFLRGTFDAGDLVAVTAGALAAAGLLYLFRNREMEHAH